MALTAEQKAFIDALVDEQRTRCLWYLRRDYFPEDDALRWRVLCDIQRHGDRAAFLRAAEAKRWLSPSSSATSASS